MTELDVEQLEAALRRRDASTVGRAYAARLQQRLELPQAKETAIDRWMDVVFVGEHHSTGRAIDAELWLEIVVVAAEALAGSHAVWCIGDGPADHLVGEHPEMGARLHAARASHPGVEAMFQAMIADYRSMGYPDAGWWSDPSVLG